VGRASIVGEKGPELFVPDRAGTIIPNNQLGGSTNVVVNVDASGSNVEGDDQSSRQLGELIAAAVQSEIVKQQMSGGLLS
jgi:bifunctional ADP-heptose synthase (sugar kinase/adenylyltransferase)